MARNIITPGDQFAKKGTTGWADWQRSRLKHALKDVNFEARQIVQVIRDMCESDEPAWYLMTRSDGQGFNTFEEFVTSPEGLAYPDYQKFRGLAVSEPGIMTEREYDLLTTAPDRRRDNRKGGKVDSATQSQNQHTMGKDKLRWLRSIANADPLVKQLYVNGLIDLKLAALLGSKEPEQKQKTSQAVAAIQGITRNGDDKVYRKAVNEAVRREFGISTGKPPLEWLRHWWEKASKEERKRFLKEVAEK